MRRASVKAIERRVRPGLKAPRRIVVDGSIPLSELEGEGRYCVGPVSAFRKAGI